jgi:hypothetical protein
VLGPFLLSHKGKTARPAGFLVSAPATGYPFRFRLRCALTAKQFAVDLRDLLEAIFHLVIVLEPLADLGHLLFGDDSAGGAPAPQRDGQIPDWPVPLASSALAGGIATGHASFHQRSAQGLGEGRELLGQTLPALAQRQFGKPAESPTCLHLSASLNQNRPIFADANPLRISPYLTDSQGNRVAVRSSWVELRQNSGTQAEHSGKSNSKSSNLATFIDQFARVSQSHK